LTVGVIEGIAESTAMLVKIFSGAISDFMGRRKGLLLLGYGLAALSKPFFLWHTRLKSSLPRAFWIASERAFVEHREMPWSQMFHRPGSGGLFCLRQSMDTLGLFLAPLWPSC
jgi:hypothetical protein